MPEVQEERREYRPQNGIPIIIPLIREAGKPTIQQH